MNLRSLSKAALKRIAAGKMPLPTEDAVQAVIVDGLRAYGFLVLVTSRRAKKCRKCGEYSHQGDGASKGIADLLVRRPSWPRGLLISLEVKTPGPINWSSEEQRLLAQAGDIVVVQSLGDALDALDALEALEAVKEIAAEPFPRGRSDRAGAAVLDLKTYP